MSILPKAPYYPKSILPKVKGGTRQPSVGRVIQLEGTGSAKTHGWKEPTDVSEKQQGVQGGWKKR